VKPVSVKAALRSSAAALDRAGLEKPLDEAERLICHLLDRDRASLYLEAGSPLCDKKSKTLQRMLQHRVEGFPLQYVTGRVGFYTCEFLTDSRALIPRPDTESVVDAVLDLAAGGMNFRRIVDVGTGSGNIAVVLARHISSGEIWATDLSAKAISLARENAALNGVDGRIRFLIADLLEPFAGGSFDLVVANLPYVSDAEWQALPREIRDHEPPVALRGGPDGLDMVRRVVRTAYGALSENGVVVLEFGHAQSGSVQALLAAAGYGDIELRRDINGKPRVAVAFKDPAQPNKNR